MTTGQAIEEMKKFPASLPFYIDGKEVNLIMAEYMGEIPLKVIATNLKQPPPGVFFTEDNDYDEA